MMSLHLHNAHQQCLESPLQKFRTQICRKALIPISLQSNKIYKILHQTPADSKSSRCQCISVCRYMFSESYLLPSIFSLITCIHLEVPRGAQYVLFRAFFANFYFVVMLNKFQINIQILYWQSEIEIMYIVGKVIPIIYLLDLLKAS